MQPAKAATAVQRLRNRAQFEATMAGRTVSRTPHFALHRTQVDVPEPTGSDTGRSQALFAVRDCWLGAVIPKRWAKRAVTRNTIKRQVYAVSASIDPPLPIAAHVVRLRAGFDRARFPSATSDALKRAVRAELQQLFARASS